MESKEEKSSLPPLTKSLEVEDYSALSRFGLFDRALKHALGFPKTRLDHPHRKWEYLMARAAIDSVFPDLGISVLDVGCGDSAWAPALYLELGDKVQLSETDPNKLSSLPGISHNREGLKAHTDKRIRFYPFSIKDLPKIGETFDVITVISTIEHVEDEERGRSLDTFSEILRPGGLLFFTTDCVDDDTVPHKSDYLRTVNYTMESLIEFGRHPDFEFYGGVDWDYHGSEVFDYTFASLCLQKA